MKRFGIHVVALVCLLATQLASAEPAAATPADPLQRCKALDLSGSTVRVPQNTPQTPSFNNGVFPVLLIHGFNDSSSTWERPAHISWSDPAKVTNPGSFLEMIGEIPGALPVLFDYKENGLNWVDSSAIGDALRDTVSCLAVASRQKVAIVAHSMGGLAARWALGDFATATQVSLVVTIGTPNLGSFLPIIVAGSSLGADVIARWTETGSKLGVETLSSRAFLDIYHALHTYFNRCQRQIANRAASGVCGDLTLLVAGLTSSAGLALTAGSTQLRDLPEWPSTGVTVHALATNYVGLGTDEWLGDGVVYPTSATAGSPQFTSTQCTLTGLPWLNELGPRRTGCWHPDQPANQSVLPLALTKLRDDIAARSRPPTDWQNTTYSLTCGGLVSNRLTATLTGGSATVSGADADAAGYDQIALSLETAVSGDLTGDGVPETAALLTCVPEPSNFFVQDVQVFGADGSLLSELPSAETLDPEGILPPEYVPEELTIAKGILSAGMRLYGPGDSHATGPSERQTFEWQWNGNSFDRVSGGQSRSTGQYTSHSVSRFGFSAELPDDFRILSASSNGDGLTLHSSDDRAEVSIYGTNNVNGESAVRVRDSYVAEAGTKGSVVTYQNVDGDAVTVSGYTPEAGIFYYHAVVGPGSINVIQWTYPASQKEQYDDAVTHSVRSLQVGDLTQPH
jgi:pimeloyl-ACP methyl ester carboxylesterase